MRKAIFLLSSLALFTTCRKSDSPSDQLDSLLKVTMTNGDVIYASPTDNMNIPWGGVGTNIPALPDISTTAVANMDFNGETNTAAIVAQLGSNNGTAYAAKVCADLEAYGFDDWYLPAIGELNEMYLKLGPAIDGGSGQITTGVYWSSSEVWEQEAWRKSFEDGAQFGGIKDMNLWYCNLLKPCKTTAFYHFLPLLLLWSCVIG